MYNQRLVFTASCLGMSIFGIVLTTLGAILPHIVDRFSLEKAVAGSLMALLSLGILLGSLLFGPIVDRYGYKNLLIICALFIIIGLEGVSLTHSLNLFRVFIFTIGLAGGIINGGTNALVVDISQDGKSANLSILGAFFGIGAVGVPIALGAFSRVITYESIIGGVGIIVILPLLFFVSLRFPSPKQAQGFPIKEGISLLKQTTLLFFGFLLFFQSGMELTIGNWTALYLKEELKIDASDATLFLSCFWIGIMLARLLLGFILKRISSTIVQFVFFGIAWIGVCVMLLSNSLLYTATGILLTGFGFAAAFPIMLGFVGDLYPHLSGTAFSIVFVMALIGGTFFPYLTGILGQAFGLKISLLIIPVNLCCMILLFSIVIRRIRKTISQ